MDALRRALGRLSACYALVFLSFALPHWGVAPGLMDEPVIIPAALVETLCAAAMLAGAHGALSGRFWAWNGLLYSHAAALGGVVLGILAMALSGNAGSALLAWYHGSMAAVLAAGLAAAFYVSRVRR
ncbi:hypothetical protein FE391_21550 [Nonomuraea sp. KC401]|uniref:Uncharacterized protein n=1 Tax=Nonomuraea longispora TaxID=1848320 RepID=A0A4R4MKL5_9ACTN|nr:MULTISPECIES: hypothetical protein [Nonomuraea]NBE98802.1 hypothetical protein [Nonomuraea sp. K271]TDB94712.1 hypothetical protein E1267_42570 [Nonomuraea longispora]TLF68678.1 hypothetical protein FE391_21550 [Nonomuraea sp. KC401]